MTQGVMAVLMPLQSSHLIAESDIIDPEVSLHIVASKRIAEYCDPVGKVNQGFRAKHRSDHYLL